MNRENIKYCIELMKRADKFSMRTYQTGYPISTSLDELHRRGQSACFAGYVAVSDKFKADGGFVKRRGVPCINEKEGAAAIAEWLDIPFKLADRLIYNRGSYYPISFEDVKPEHVIEKMEEILNRNWFQRLIDRM